MLVALATVDVAAEKTSAALAINGIIHAGPVVKKKMPLVQYIATTGALKARVETCLNILKYLIMFKYLCTN